MEAKEQWAHDTRNEYPPERVAYDAYTRLYEAVEARGLSGQSMTEAEALIIAEATTLMKAWAGASHGH